MKKILKITLLVFCIVGFTQIAQAQTIAELKESLKKAQEAEKKALIQAKLAEDTKLMAIQQSKEAIIQANQAHANKLEAEKARDEALQALEVTNKEKAILEKKVEELTKKQKTRN